MAKQTIKIKKRNFLPSNLIRTTHAEIYISLTSPNTPHQISKSESHVCVFVAKFKNGTKKFITLLIILRGFKSFTPEVGVAGVLFYA